MESPGSDLVVEEQRVRKNSNRGASSSAGTPRPRQADVPDIETPIRTPSVRVDSPSGNKSGLIIMQPVIIKTDIPSVFKQSDMSYLKERFDMPSQVKLSAPRPLEKADSPRDGWICLYEIAFKIGLRLPFHHIINMVLNFYSIAPGQLMPNSWRYLLGLIAQSEKCGLQIDMATFLYFFYMKPSEEGRYTLYARRRIRLFEDAPTSDKGWKDRYFFVKREGLCNPVGTSESGIRSAWTERGLRLRAFYPYFLKIPSVDCLASLEEATSSVGQRFEEEDPSRLLYSMPTDPLWASYPAADMGKLKMKISKAELEATKKKKRDKQAAAKGGASSQTDKGEERPTSMVVVEPSSLPITIPSGDSPPSKRPRCSSPPAPAQDKGKEKQTPSMLRLEDSSTIRSNSSMVGPIVDSLMTRHDRSLLREMTLDEVGLEAEQNALKLAQNARYLYDAVIKVDKACKKKAEAYINAVAANKTLEENSLAGHSRPEEEDGQEDMEITSSEDEPNDGDAPLVNQPEAPRLDVEPNQVTSNDSFEEAMRLLSNEESGPG
ncbi:hypothetical protein FNV43_RR02604 [Rhamnella rubrinervis]|uniref:Transposase (putative) gypsy type domain-containing protein n=1 Tax=Rhamnella rubrinervis TaxID=2594499 RepID=A0A8K0MTW1_9ROSA|nr:hypothetical protein FNV43_RR02604 [Rhamnella rubrinervis]